MTATRTVRKPLFHARDAERVQRELWGLADGGIMDELGYSLQLALQGSDEATRAYLRAYKTLALRLLDEAQRERPGVVARNTDGTIGLVSVNGNSSRAPIEALESAAAQAPFARWTSRFELGDAVALYLTSQLREMIGLRGLDASGHEVRPLVDDLSAHRFLRRVRHHLNHPDGEHPLPRAMDAFGLSKTELAGLFGVRRQAIDQWLSRGVPASRQEKVQTLIALCDLLERKLKPDRLPGVARRPAGAYGGKTMLELIEEDRHRELLESVRDSFDWAAAA